jgi:hypothetical protein
MQIRSQKEYILDRINFRRSTYFVLGSGIGNETWITFIDPLHNSTLAAQKKTKINKTYVCVMCARENMSSLETNEIRINDFETRYEATRVTSVNTFSIRDCLRNVVSKKGYVVVVYSIQRTPFCVFDVVG